MRRILLIQISILILSFDGIANSNFDSKIQLAKTFLNTDMNKALSLAQEAEAVASTKSELGRIYWMIGRIHDSKDDPINAVHYYYAASKIYRDLENAKYEAMLLENIGTINLNYTLSSSAITTYQTALEVVPNDSYSLIASLQFDLALAYKQDNDIHKAIEWLYNALTTLRIHDQSNADLFARVHNEIGRINQSIAVTDSMPNYLDSAVHHYDQAIAWADSDLTRFWPIMNKGSVLMDQGYYDQASEKLYQALNIGKGIGSGRLVIPALNNLGNLAIISGDHHKADSIFRLAINLNIQEKDWTKQYYDLNHGIGMYNLSDLTDSYISLESISDTNEESMQSVMLRVQNIISKKEKVEAITKQNLLEKQNERFRQEETARLKKLMLFAWIERIALILVSISALIGLSVVIRKQIKRKHDIAAELRHIENEYNV